MPDNPWPVIHAEREALGHMTATAEGIRRETACTPADTLIHGEDIRRPLGIKHQYPTAAVVRVADFYKGSNLIVGAKRRIAGLSLKATDAEWRTGDGVTTLSSRMQNGGPVA